MRQEWEEQRLAEVASITMGQSPDGDTYNTRGDGAPLINGPVEFSSGPFDETVRSKFTSKPTKLCKKGDLILCVRGSTTGRMNIAGFDACIGRGVAAIRAKQYQPWINYFIRFKQQEIYNLGTGATFPNVSSGMLATMKISMPPLPEQKLIVVILDEAFEGIDTMIANTEKNLANARELFDGYLNSVFVQAKDAGVQKRLGDIATFKNGLNFTKGSKGEIIKIVGVKDFRKNFFVPNTQLETAQIGGRLGADYELRAGDILTVRSNGNKQLIGRCILAGEVTEKTSHSGFTIRIRVNPEEAAPTYLVHFLKSKASREILIESGDGTNISSLNQKALSALPVALPPLADQLPIIDRIDAIAAETKNLESVYQQKLDSLAELKQAILHKAFAGKLAARPEKALQEAAE